MSTERNEYRFRGQNTTDLDVTVDPERKEPMKSRFTNRISGC